MGVQVLSRVFPFTMATAEAEEEQESQLVGL
jgi:hypothetical protein